MMSKELSDFINNIVLASLYSVEDHIKYCDKNKIPYRFDLCTELKRIKYTIDDGHYFKIDDNKYLSAQGSGNTLYINLCESNDKLTINYKFDDLDCKYFNGQNIELNDIEILRFISEYVRCARSLTVIKTLTKRIDYELHTIIQNLNTHGVLYTNEVDLACDIGLFKMILVSDNANKIYKRLYLHDSNIVPYEGNKAIEHLIINVSNPYEVRLNNLPNLKILTINIVDFDEEFCTCGEAKCICYEGIVNIVANNVPNLKIIICDRSDTTVNINIPNIEIR